MTGGGKKQTPSHFADPQEVADTSRKNSPTRKKVLPSPTGKEDPLGSIPRGRAPLIEADRIPPHTPRNPNQSSHHCKTKLRDPNHFFQDERDKNLAARADNVLRSQMDGSAIQSCTIPSHDRVSKHTPAALPDPDWDDRPTVCPGPLPD